LNIKTLFPTLEGRLKSLLNREVVSTLFEGKVVFEALLSQINGAKTLSDSFIDNQVKVELISILRTSFKSYLILNINKFRRTLI